MVETTPTDPEQGIQTYEEAPNLNLCNPRIFWYRLKLHQKKMIVGLIQVLLGMADCVLDWVVALEFFLDDKSEDSLSGGLLLGVILFSGLIAFVVGGGMNDRTPWWQFPFYVVGASTIFQFIELIQKSDEHNSGMKLKFGRIMEVIFEAVPAGAIQVYIMFYNGDFRTSIVLSVTASIISMAYAMGTTFAWQLPFQHRGILGFMVAADFLFRTISFALLMKFDSDLFPIIFPSILVFEGLILMSNMLFQGDDEDLWASLKCLCLGFPCILILALPNTCSCIWTLLFRHWDDDEADVFPTLQFGCVIMLRWFVNLAFVCVVFAAETNTTDMASAIVVAVSSFLSYCMFLCIDEDHLKEIGQLSQLVHGDAGPLVKE